MTGSKLVKLFFEVFDEDCRLLSLINGVGDNFLAGYSSEGVVVESSIVCVNKGNLVVPC